MKNAPETMQCPMCGLDFPKVTTICASGCPMAKGCSHVRCPGCDFEMPDTPRVIQWMRRLMPAGRTATGAATGRDGHNGHNGNNGGGIGLDSLRAGERACVRSVGCASNSSRRNTLTVFGMVPGTEITLLQRSPAYVVRVGETELGLDSAIARDIRVERL